MSLRSVLDVARIIALPNDKLTTTQTMTMHY